MNHLRFLQTMTSILAGAIPGGLPRISLDPKDYDPELGLQRMYLCPECSVQVLKSDVTCPCCEAQFDLERDAQSE